ncbi:MAG TPA: sulfite exporter TauE/SafE family protein, partial [Tepidisphaeraceae bacterium]|nr:sulfite exporter TauE/SafE family protein [Tepidisphaeraceae bacterium]
ALTGIARLSEKVANMTSTIGLWPGSAASVVAAKSEFRRLPVGMVIAFSLISLTGGGIGAWLLLATSVATFRLVIPWLLAFATVVFAFSKPIARWAGRQHGHRTAGWTLVVATIQLFVAIYGGYFGAGIGVLMLAGLSFAGLDDIHQMNAMKVLLATLINGVAAIVFLFYTIDWRIAGAMAAASIVGGFLGMRGGRRLHPNQLRLLILAVGVALTAYYFYNAYAKH